MTPANPMPRKARNRRGKPPGRRISEQQPVQNARQQYERYLALARAQALNGDQIAAENYLQHAEHYLRSMREAAAPEARQ
jgi:hypothetical protein